MSKIVLKKKNPTSRATSKRLTQNVRLCRYTDVHLWSFYENKIQDVRSTCSMAHRHSRKTSAFPFFKKKNQTLNIPSLTFALDLPTGSI
jgi:hypothetical protein